MNWSVKILHTAEKDFDKWKDYYKRLDKKGIYHSPEYIKFLEKHYDDEAELFVYGDEENFVYYPYFKRRLDKLSFADKYDSNLSELYDIISSWYYGGPLFSSSNQSYHKELARNFVDSFHRYCMDINVISEFIRFDPNLENHLTFNDLLEVKQNRHTVYVNLNKGKEEIWRDLKGSNRRNINNARKAGVEIVESRSEVDIKLFAEIYNEEMLRKGAPSHLFFSIDFFVHLLKGLSSGFSLLKIEYNNKVIGGFIIAYGDNMAHHFLSASLPEYWRYRVNNLLFYEAVLWAWNANLSTFDFQGGRTNVLRFKENFSSLRKTFYTASVIYNNDIYNELCGIGKEVSSLEGRNSFPEYRNGCR